MSDRGYLTLLNHLSRSTTSLPLNTLRTSIAHYLAHVQPSPTPLAGSVVSSPYFRSASHPRLDALQTAFRHAVHFKIKLLKDAKGGLFTLGLSSRTGAWVSDILKGLQGGNASLRLACAGGLLLGLGDWERELPTRDSRMRAKVEEEVIVSLAEVMDLHAHTSYAWEHEFASDAEDILWDALLIAAQSVPLVDARRLTALPLAALARMLLSAIDTAFESGTFLASLSDSLQRTSEDKLAFRLDSPFESKIHALSGSPLLSSMASLSAMHVQLLSCLADTQPKEAWLVMSETLHLLDTMTSKVEADWLRTALASVAVSEEDAIVFEAKQSLTTMWTVLKTLLFTTVRLVQATLSIVVFVPQPRAIPPSTSASISVPVPSGSGSTTTQLETPSVLSLTSLHIFSHLSFVLPQFGGVASTPSAEAGFPELKQAFYTALDVLSADPVESARFVRELRETVVPSSSTGPSNAQGWPKQFMAAKKAYALACVEQLVPVLGDESVRVDLYPLCAPHLDDASDRETFESAHSVVLAMFAASADNNDKHLNDASVPEAEVGRDEQTLTFAEEFVPAYVKCLLENAAEGKLNIIQLRLAFRALVRCAGALGRSRPHRMSPSFIPADSQPSADPDVRRTSGAVDQSPLSHGDTLASYCIFALLQKMNAAASPGERHRLALALVSSVSAVSLVLLPDVLDAARDAIEAIDPAEEVEGAVESYNAAGRKARRRRELVEALFEEIARRMGDEEKEYAVRWWYENKTPLLCENEQEQIVGAEYLSGLKNKGKELMARL